MCHSGREALTGDLAILIHQSPFIKKPIVG